MSAEPSRPDEIPLMPRPAEAPLTLRTEPANSPQPTVPVTPFAGRPRLPESGLRVLPLDSFVWGGATWAGGLRRGRTRGDHCLIRVTAGTMRIILPSGAVDHGAGSVVFIPAGIAFAAEPQPGVRGQVLLMARQMAERLSLPSRIVVGAGVSDAFSADLAALAARAHDPIAAATAACRVELIATSLERLAARPQASRPELPGRDSHALVQAYLDFAGREMGRGRTIADLADALGATAAGLDAACRKHRGCSALDLLYELRLDRARAMLADPRHSLSQIAEELGFTGVAHMNRVFMAATGRPAEAFRRLN
ncbi:helix-turn-helix domain-containing protein [Paracoccus chinensis]|uniref:AraC family transcriptional regulator, transcriptional activator of pobA n=1 Tax=Paracoccus chinensis TaxID=525640 RepID=A0A1G9LZ96_9RHOB|nr:helix-turn-helix domain-containing protein [Paracoccus chinensis]SDL66997.1 AraC family transcriptional regulator, transcriptional activator of pobA [Paracoccus chinensis]